MTKCVTCIAFVLMIAAFCSQALADQGISEAKRVFGLFRRALKDNNLELAYKYISQCEKLMPENGSIVYNRGITVQKIDPASNLGYILFLRALKLGIPESHRKKCEECILDFEYEAQAKKFKLLKLDDWETRKAKYKSADVEKTDARTDFVFSHVNKYDYLEYTHIKTGLAFVLVSGGSFMMGSNVNSDEKPVHRVTLSPFLMSKTEVTQGVWERIMGTTPWKGKSSVKEGSDYPATYVSWNDARDFCSKTGLKLPTEAQWEYACRSGTTTKYYWGNNMDGAYCWYKDNANDKGEEYAHQVNQKTPNAFGLYDMSGNVWEWCRDWYGSKYCANSPQVNPTGPSTGSYRVIRGGSWGCYADGCRSAFRNSYSPGYRLGSLGFRVVSRVP